MRYWMLRVSMQDGSDAREDFLEVEPAPEPEQQSDHASNH